jgi:hypothetical protein
MDYYLNYLYCYNYLFIYTLGKAASQLMGALFKYWLQTFFF